MTDRDRLRIAEEIAALEAERARRRTLPFVQRVNPAYEANWHHGALAHALDAVLRGECRRLMVFMPPQNGKSELVSRSFPALALGRDPDSNVVTASYNADLAKAMSRDVQRVVASREYRTLFPGTRLATARDTGEVRAAAEFSVVGRRGSYRAVGVGQGVSGRPMDLGIIDDPYPGRNEAESAAYRKMVWNWYVGDFSNRMSSDAAALVLVQTRWHEDDLAGRLLEIARKNPTADQWRVVKFPAVCEAAAPGDPRQPGDVLWPARFSRAWLEAKRIASGIYDWSSLFQQEPVPAGGAMAQRAWFKVGPPRGGVKRRCRCWDLAATKPVPGRDPDWTVGTRLAEHADGTWTVEHVVRVRETPGTVDGLIRSTAYADGRDVLVREWLDPGAAGKSVVDNHRRMLAGFDYDALPSSGEKSTRWRPFFVQAEGGSVWVAEGAWNTDWLDELAHVPYGKHDDQADSAAGAFLALTAHVDRGIAAAAVMPTQRAVLPPGRRVVEDWRAERFR